MRYRVLLLSGHLGDGLAHSRDEYNRVVAESVGPDFSIGYDALDLSRGLDQDPFRRR